MKKFYTNGVKTIKLSENDIIPEGFYKGRTFNVNTWNKGLTKDTDERVRKNCAKCHQTRKIKNNYHSWNKGLNKYINESLNIVSVKVSKYRKAHPFTDEQILRMNDNIYKTKKKNKSFSTSKPELEYYNYLKTIYSEDDIIREYKSDKYPFKCDFYIKSIDTYIELNLTWFHGYHPFDKTDPKDMLELNRRIQKSKNSKAYEYSIKIWTESDVLKLQTLKENKLNFMIIYPKNLVIKSNYKEV